MIKPNNMWRRFSIILLIVSLIYCQDAICQGKLIQDSIYSPSLDKVKHFNIWIPESKSQNKLPVLYMLHGAWGNYKNWTDKTNILDHPKAKYMYMIFVDGDDSFYVNSAYKSDQKYEDYIVIDLIPSIEEKYNISGNTRGIAGLSMGGYGAFYLSTKHPELFIFCGSLSGALSLPLMSYNWHKNDENNNEVRTIVMNAFGIPDDNIYRSFDLVYLLSKSDNRVTPYYYLVHGIQDGFKDFLPAHRLLTEHLGSNSFRYEYHELPGKHNWAFWNQEINHVINAFVREVEALKKL